MKRFVFPPIGLLGVIWKIYVMIMGHPAVSMLLFGVFLDWLGCSLRRLSRLFLGGVLWS